MSHDTPLPRLCAHSLACVVLVAIGPLLVPGSFGAEDAPQEFESRAILGLVVTQDGPLPEAEREAEALRIDLLAWPAVHQLVSGRRVDFGRPIDPDDPRQLERVYRELQERTRVRAISYRHIEVAFRSPRPELNAAVVNELVQRLLSQERREAEEAAKLEIRLLQENLERARAALEELGARTRDFIQANPGLPESPHELFRRREEVEERARALQHETRECQAHLERVRERLLRRQGDDEGAERERQELNHEALNAERRLAELAERRADLAKRAETLEALSRRAPELIAQREAMQRELEAMGDAVRQWGERTRAAEHELRRIASGALPPRFRVVEEARPERRPPARGEEAITEDGAVLRTLRDLREPNEDVRALDSLVKGNVRFVQLDADGRPTAVTHFFREAPEPGQGFTLRVQDGRRGTVALYRLVNLGTGEAFEFRDVAVKRTPDGGWAITDEGWRLITDQLAARMKVKLGRPNLR